MLRRRNAHTRFRPRPSPPTTALVASLDVANGAIALAPAATLRMVADGTPERRGCRGYDARRREELGVDSQPTRASMSRAGAKVPRYERFGMSDL
jgi:hypothetical protein